MNKNYTENQYIEKLNLLIELLTTNKNISDEKIAFFIAGQPGSGKTTLTLKAIHFNNNNLIVINRDDFRKFHPNIEKFNFLENDYLTYTNDFSARITEDLINILSNKSYNLLIETTFRTYDTPFKTSTILKTKGYKIKSEILMVHPILSYLSTMTRYINQEKLNLIPRTTPKTIHDETVLNLPNNLDQFFHNKIFDEVRIVNRNGDIIYDSTNIKTNPKNSYLKYNVIDEKAITKEIEYVKHNILDIKDLKVRNLYLKQFDEIKDELINHRFIEFKKSYINFLKNEFNQEITIKDDNIIQIAYIENIVENKDYDLKIEYDIFNQKEIITIINNDMAIEKVKDIPIIKYNSYLQKYKFDEFLNHHKNKINFNEIEELLILYEINPNKFSLKSKKMGLIIKHIDSFTKDLER